MPIEIKPIEPGQIAETKRMLVTAAKETFNEEKSVDELLAGWLDWLSDIDDVQAHYFARRGIFLVVLDDGCIIGSGAIRVIDEKICELKRMWLLQAYHGKGIGYRVIQELFTFARGAGYEMVRLETGPQQTRAINFYKRIGFHIVPTLDGDPDDVWMEMKL